MSLFQDAIVQIVLADYIAGDPTGKMNIIGGGVSLLGDQGNGVSAPFSVAATVLVPERYAGQTYALTLELHDVSVGGVVTIPTPPSGQREALRAQEIVTVQPIALQPPLLKPQDLMVSHVMAMNFGAGLPLPVGHSFEFRVQIDGDKRKDWFARFHRPAVGGVVLGGPAGPSSIPGVADHVMPPSDEETTDSSE